MFVDRFGDDFSLGIERKFTARLPSTGKVFHCLILFDTNFTGYLETFVGFLLDNS